MERLFQQSLGIPVIAEDVKSPIGIIKDFIVNTENGKIMAFVLNIKKNLIVSEQDISVFDFFPRVKSIDCLIEGKDVVRVYEVQKKNLFFIGNKVFTEKGKYLGICEDFSYDDTLFMIKKIFISRRFLRFFVIEERIFSIEDIVKVKKDRIIVKDDSLAEKQPSLATS